MSPFAIVEHLDVLEDRPPGFFLCQVFFMIHQLGLERAEEAFGDGIVVAVAFAAHRTDRLMILQQLLIRVTGILHATV